MRLLDGRSGDDVELTFDEHFHAGGSEVGDRPSHAWQHAAGFMDSVQVYLRHSFSLVCYYIASLWSVIIIHSVSAKIPGITLPVGK